MSLLKRLSQFILKIILIIFLISFVQSCVPDLSNKSSLTDENVMNYLSGYKKLREKAPEILQNLNENKNDVESGMQRFNTFEEIIKESGLENYADFVRLNAKIGTIFSVIQANKGMNRFEKLNTDSKTMFDKNIKFLEEQLADPDVPEETKKEIRETIQKLKNGKTELTKNWEKNEKWANLVLKNVQKLTKLIVSKEDIEVVLRHENEIMEAYVGFPMPKYE